MRRARRTPAAIYLAPTCEYLSSERCHFTVTITSSCSARQRVNRDNLKVSVNEGRLPAWPRQPITLREALHGAKYTQTRIRARAATSALTRLVLLRRRALTFVCVLIHRTTLEFAMADVPTLSITLLGAGQEVGRSCCVLQYRGKTIVCDAGVHPAYSGIASLPFIDELDWSTVDVMLITQ